MNHIQSPDTGDSAIEREIKARGLTAPRITPEDLQANIVSEHYFTAAEGSVGATGRIPFEPPASHALDLLTFCVLVLRNGFTVTGESACASPENFDAEVGRKVARANAVQKIWPLMGYELKSKLAFGAERTARVAHEVNRSYCEALGDLSQPAWEVAPEWQRSSARMGVDLHTMGDFGPEASHRSWATQKLAEGWQYGPVKDAEKKEHPCLVPFHELPPEQQAKDFIFRGVVHALTRTPI
jgi:hypothetical protein